MTLNMKIEFGCGNTLEQGWEGCDVRPLPHIKFVCPAWEIVTHVAPGSVESVHSRHMLEHLTFHDADRTLRAWRTILKVGGKGTVMVPDMPFHVNQWMTQRHDEGAFQWALAGFWGWQRETDTGEVWDVHKSGYDEALLTDKLKGAGFREVERIHTEPQHLFLRFW